RRHSSGRKQADQVRIRPHRPSQKAFPEVVARAARNGSLRRLGREKWSTVFRPNDSKQSKRGDIMPNSHQVRKTQWRELEESLGKRHAGGKDCPPHDVEIFRLALAAAQEKPLASAEASALYEHFSRCELCRIKYESSLDSLQKELENAPD